MGHYQRKPYKKNYIEILDAIDVEKELMEAFSTDDPLDYDDDRLFDEIEDSFMISDEKTPIIRSTTILNEPEIVKQLRKEEMEGTLPTWNVSGDDGSTSKEQIPTEEKNWLTPHHPVDISYDKILEMARKSLRSVSTKEKKTVIHEK